MLSRRQLLIAASAAAPSVAAAQTTWPSKPIRWIVNFPPAGAADILSRTLAEWFGAKLGQPIVVENKPGAGGLLGADIVAKARGDTHLVMMSSAASHGIGPVLYKDVPYDKLVLATGSYPFVPPVAGKDRRDCFVYRTIEDLEVITATARRSPVRSLGRDPRGRAELDRRADVDPCLSVLVARGLRGRHPHHLRPRGLRRAASTGLSSATASNVHSSTAPISKARSSAVRPSYRSSSGTSRARPSGSSSRRSRCTSSRRA